MAKYYWLCIKRYSDADKFAEDVCVFNPIDEHSANAVISLLHRQPTADIVEVVRCEKCKYQITHTCRITGVKTLFCDYGEKPVAVEPTHFCSYGEKKEDEI